MSGGAGETSGLTSRRNAYLDALRGVAVLLVVGHHASLRFGEGRGWLADFLASVGWIGVDIFFAISGFLVVRSLIGDSRAGSVRRFFVRRAFRIVPIYAVALSAYFLGQMVVHGGGEGLAGFWIPALFLTSFMIPILGESAVPFTITWSLSVEEFAYLILGGMFAFGILRLKQIILFLILIPVLLRAFFLLTETIDPLGIYYFALTRIDAIGFGAAAALGGLRFWRGGIFTASTVVVFLVFAFADYGRSDWRVVTFGYASFGVACAVLVRELDARRRIASTANVLLVSSLSRVGLVSYFIYLFHLFSIELFARLGLVEILGGGMGFLAFLTAAAGMTYIAAEISWRFIEAPLISFARRID